MNFQPLIDNLPYILVGLGALLWALAKVITAYAQRDPKIDKWDDRAAMLHNVSTKYAQALEWLVTSGYVKWSGAEKLAELNKRVSEFEKLWSEGRYVEALSNLSGFYQSAMSKIQKVQGAVLPFVPRPSIVTNQGESGSSQGQAEIGPDSPAVEDSNGK